LRGFWGLAGYYRRFIPHYALICQPLHNALKKNSLKWGEEQQVAFSILKEVMYQPPLLALPNLTTRFTLETDACDTGLGAVLMQEVRPLAYFSHALCPKNAAMAGYETEALAILEALKKWRHYFLGNKVLIKTDQCSLKYLASQRLLKGSQHKIMLKLSEIDYSIQYKKGTENSAADALSKKYQPVDIEEEQENCQGLAVAIPSWTNDIITSYIGDEACIKLLQEVTIDSNNHAHYSVQSGILRYKGRLYIGASTDLR
jgi:hypothetical protein